MYNYSQVLQGIINYIDREIVAKISGWQKWVIGAGIGLSMKNTESIFEKVKNNPMVASLNVIDKDNNIDVDTLYQEFKKQAQKASITFDTKIAGVLTLNEQDVDKLYQYIKEQR